MFIRFRVVNWATHRKHFLTYLKLERSLSNNSIEAYGNDVLKLEQFMEMRHPAVSPLKVSSTHLQQFVEYLHKLGMSAHSHARILSGVRAFYK
ncbi:MAG TPA: site-specific integrase, partial [Chryseosolibacter sp.]|nr:site-specific integrase [Chryseosolibacter sp.]